MTNLTPEAMKFVAFILCIMLPPFSAAWLLKLAFAGERTNEGALIASGLLLLLWVPLLMVAPQILINFNS